MTGLLSLPEELIERVGEEGIRSQQAGLREWCRVTSTCKLLWNMHLPGSAIDCSMNLDVDIKGAPWVLERITATHKLSSRRWHGRPKMLDMDVLHQAVKAMTRASRSFWNLTTLIFHIYQEDPFEEIPQEKYLQYWISASLLGATKLTSLSMRADSLPWTPVLGLLSIRQLELTMKWVMPWLDVIVDDLTFCSCLETLKITESMEGEWECISMRLPDLCFHHVATLKSVELLGWYPKGKFTLHLGCLLRLGVALQTHTQWKQCQAKCQPLSMLCLKCVKLRAWPAGIGETSGLQYLALECRKMQDQDLAALQHIPCVFLAFEKYSSLLLARGSWQRLALCGCAGFTMSFARVDEFVRGTKRFLFDSTVQEAGEMFGVLRAACMRQGSAYYMCEPTDEYAENPKRALFSNVQLCRAPQDDTAYDKYHQVHEKFIRMDGFWPC